MREPSPGDPVADSGAIISGSDGGPAYPFANALAGGLPAIDNDDHFCDVEEPVWCYEVNKADHLVVGVVSEIEALWTPALVWREPFAVTSDPNACTSPGDPAVRIVLDVKEVLRGDLEGRIEFFVGGAYVYTWKWYPGASAEPPQADRVVPGQALGAILFTAADGRLVTGDRRLFYPAPDGELRHQPYECLPYQDAPDTYPALVSSVADCESFTTSRERIDEYQLDMLHAAYCIAGSSDGWAGECVRHSECPGGFCTDDGSCEVAP